MKQPHPEILLEGVDLMADRHRGDEQLLGRFAEAHMAGGGFERAQGREGRQVIVHQDEKF